MKNKKNNMKKNNNLNHKRQFISKLNHRFPNMKLSWRFDPAHKNHCFDIWSRINSLIFLKKCKRKRDINGADLIQDVRNVWIAIDTNDICFKVLGIRTFARESRTGREYITNELIDIPSTDMKNWKWRKMQNLKQQMQKKEDSDTKKGRKKSKTLK